MLSAKWMLFEYLVLRKDTHYQDRSWKNKTKQKNCILITKEENPTHRAKTTVEWFRLKHRFILAQSQSKRDDGKVFPDARHAIWLSLSYFEKADERKHLSPELQSS